MWTNHNFAPLKILIKGENRKKVLKWGKPNGRQNFLNEMGDQKLLKEKINEEREKNQMLVHQK